MVEILIKLLNQAQGLFLLLSLLVLVILSIDFEMLQVEPFIVFEKSFAGNEHQIEAVAFRIFFNRKIFDERSLLSKVPNACQVGLSKSRLVSQDLQTTQPRRAHRLIVFCVGEIFSCA